VEKKIISVVERFVPLRQKGKMRFRYWWRFAATLAIVLSVGGLMAASVSVRAHEPPNRAPSWTPVLMPLVAGSQAYSTSLDDVVASWDTGSAEPSQSYPHKQFLPLIAGKGGSALEAPFGVHIYGREPIVASRTYEAGARWVRIPFHWDYIEPENTTPENYRWSAALEEQLADLSTKNVRVILMLHFNPSWAATYSGGPIDLAPMSELVEFMTASVARYGAPPYNVKHWEIYNEPDNSWEYYAEKGYGYFGHNPQGYVDILSAIYGPIKAIDPNAKVVFGGLSHDWLDTDEYPGPFVEDFVDNVLLLGGGDYFDVMNFHYYATSHIRWDQYGQGIIGKATHLRDKLAAQGVVDKPFICTEAGMWSSEYSDPPGSDELQSRYVGQLFARSAAADLEFTIWFKLVDSPQVGATLYGLTNADYSPKPAFNAFQTASAQMTTAAFVRTLDPSETGSEESEAYAFLSHDGTTNIFVAWTNDDLAHDLRVATDDLVAVDMFGAENPISDGDDGVVDGYVTVTLGPNPQYLRFAAGATR
jgi:hypothetical protein